MIDDRLSQWLFPQVRTAVLASLLLEDQELHARELARVTGFNHAAIGKELRAMAAAGIAVERRSGNRVYFSADQSCPVYHELRMLMVKTAGVAGLIRSALQPLTGQIELAYVYGSMAKGTFRRSSDVDLMVVGEVDPLDVIGALDTVERELHREINPTVYGLEEYRQGIKSASGFVHHVHHGAKTVLIGDPDELKRT